MTPDTYRILYRDPNDLMRAWGSVKIEAVGEPSNEQAKQAVQVMPDTPDEVRIDSVRRVDA